MCSKLNKKIQKNLLCFFIEWWGSTSTIEHIHFKNGISMLLFRWLLLTSEPWLLQNNDLQSFDQKVICANTSRLLKLKIRSKRPTSGVEEFSLVRQEKQKQVAQPTTFFHPSVGCISTETRTQLEDEAPGSQTNHSATSSLYSLVIQTSTKQVLWGGFRGLSTSSDTCFFRHLASLCNQIGQLCQDRYPFLLEQKTLPSIIGVLTSIFCIIVINTS